MATQTIEFAAPSGQTITAKLFAAGSDTIEATASSVTARTNAAGVYVATVTSTLAGVYRLVATNPAGTLLAQWWVRLANADGTYIAYETPNADYVDATVSSRSTFAGGAVASVTGNVGGNVVGSVGSISGVTFPSNFAALAINASGHVSRVVLVDTTTANSDMRGTDNALLAASYTAPLNTAGTAAAVWNSLLTTYTTAGSFGARVVRSTDSNSSLQITGSNHAAAVLHDAEPNSIPADALAAATITAIQAGLATTANQTTILDRLGAFTGSGVNTVLGFLKAVMSKAASTPSDVGGTFSATTDAIEAIRDAQAAAAGDASQATLEDVQDTVNSIAAAISGAAIEVVARVADGGAITLFAGDDARVRSGTEIAVSISDVGGAIHSRLDTIGLANLAFGASRPSQPAGAIQGTVAALTVVGAGASQTVRIDLEIEDAGERLAYADNYVWQIVSSTAQGSEYDNWTEVEGTLAVRRRVAVPVHA